MRGFLLRNRGKKTPSKTISRGFQTTSRYDFLALDIRPSEAILFLLKSHKRMPGLNELSVSLHAGFTFITPSFLKRNAQKKYITVGAQVFSTIVKGFWQ